MEKNKNERREIGVVLPLVLVSMLAVFAVGGLALDTGLAFKHRKDSQLAADAAALAGAHELFRGGTSGDAVAAAREAAAVNGYTHGSGDVEVNVFTPPATGFYAGNNMSVEVTVERPTATSFLRVIEIDELDVGTRAVANGDQAASFNCIYALDPDDEGSFEVTSDSVLDAPCGIQVNSNNYRASKVESGACVKAALVGITGGYTEGQVCDSGGGDAYECSISDSCPTTGVPPAPDPLANYNPPAVSYAHCDFEGEEKESGGPYERYLVDGGTHTLSPGVYCGGISISSWGYMSNYFFGWTMG